MTDEEICADLEALGITSQTLPVVVLLPLVQVAWADGQVQEAERHLLLEVARERLGLGFGSLAVLQRWMTTPPRADELARGRRVVAALALRESSLAQRLPNRLEELVLEQCHQVARAAGGLLGVLWTVDDEENAAIAEVVGAFDEARLRLIAQLPSGEEGWEDLPEINR